MSTAACMKAMHDLDEAGELYMVYDHHRPRRFEGMPFNPNSEKWRNQEWALLLRMIKTQSGMDSNKRA